MRGALPTLDEGQARAFALVALAGRPRREAALRLQADEAELSADLAVARKALRRTIVELRGSGWCERAERLVSDRLDDVLDETGAARLDVHLRNCARCVEHERRLVQATDSLLAAASGPAPAAPGPAAAPPPAAVDPAPAAVPVEPARAPAPPPPRALPDLARSLSWHVLLVLAVLLSLASLALTVAGVLGADL